MLKIAQHLLYLFPKNLYIIIGFVFVNGPRKSYFVDALGSFKLDIHFVFVCLV